MDFVWFIVVGVAAGFTAGLLMKGKGFGFVGNLVVGIVGGVIGGGILKLLGLRVAGLVGQLVAAVIGAVALLAVINFLSGKKK